MSPRVGMVLRAALAVFGLALLAMILSTSRPASAQTPPPASGTWEVSDTTFWNGTVTLMGDLVVKAGGDLTLRDMELSFWCYQKLEFGVKVEGGGALTASNVVFQARNQSLPYRFVINWNAVAALDNCTIRNVGGFGQTRDTWGVYVHSPYANFTHCTITNGNVGLLVHGTSTATIFGCTISDNYDRGIWCMYASPFIANNRLQNNSYGIYLEESPGVPLLNNHLLNNRREALAMDANSTVAEWVVDEPVSWEGSTVLLRGNLTVREGGSLAVRDSAITVDSTGDSRKAISVLRGGALAVCGSIIGPVPGGGDRAFAFMALEGSTLTLDGAAVHGAGYASTPSDRSLAGVYIASDARINGSDLSGNMASLLCDGGRLLVTNTTLDGWWKDLVLDGGSVRFLNVSYKAGNVSFSSTGLFEAGWYLAAGVVWQNGRGVSGATLTVRDSAQTLLFDGRPGPDGWVRWIEAVKYRTRDLQEEPARNIVLLARTGGLPDISREVDVTENREEALLFTDPAPPTVVISFPQNGFGTNQSWVVITGTASDDIRLDRVELRLDDSLRWTALPAGDWSFNLTNLTWGDHLVSVRATDVAGQSSWANLSLVVDFEPPRLELDEPFDESVLTNRSGIRFRGRTDAGATLAIDGAPVPVDAAGAFDTTLNLTEGRHVVMVVARDRGGNTVSAARNITVDLTAPPIVIFSPVNGTRTRLDELPLVGRVEPGAKFRVDGSTVQLDQDGGFNVTVLLSGGAKEIELYAEDRAGNSNTTAWRLDRIIDRPASETAMQRYGMALALAAVLVAAAAGVAAVALVRRKRRAPPRAAPMAEPPPLGPRRL